MAAKIEQGMQAKQNEGMASTQVMLRVADILNERGTIDDVEPALRGAVAQELGFYLNPRKNSTELITAGTAESNETDQPVDGGEMNESANV
ncbi:hypothetical protein [Lacticaseibacillus saniviri]|nr:hypothetical protein [Lacticaseibacillus saniviri]